MADGLRAEIIYSGVKKIPIPLTGSPAEIDIDGNGTADLTFVSSVMSTMDIPPSVFSGRVRLFLGEGTRILCQPEGTSFIIPVVSALPPGFSVAESAASPFSWFPEWSTRPITAFDIASWSQSREFGWRGWQRVARDPDPVIGLEITTGNEKKYGWLRFRFGAGIPSAVQVYDWAYNSETGTPITARAGHQGVLTPTPPKLSGGLVISLGETEFRVSLNGSKAIPPSSASFTGTASVRLNGVLLTGRIDLSNAPSIPNALLQYEVILQGPGTEIALPYNFPEPFIRPMLTSAQGDLGNIQAQQRSLILEPVELSSDLETAVRNGQCHLLFKSAPGNDIRGRIARVLPETPSESEEEIAGEYSLLLQVAQQEQNSRALPSGAGHGRLSISSDRNVSLEVTLPVGAPLRWRGKLRQDNTISINIPTSQTGIGSELNGTLALTRDGNETVVSGDLQWKRRRNPVAPRYPHGFTVTLHVDGSRFQPHSRRTGTYQLSFEGGDLPAPISLTVNAIESEVQVTAPNSSPFVGGRKTFTLQVPNENPHQVSLNFDSLNGSFRGSFRHPSTNALIPFSGRFLSDSDVGLGSFRGKRSSGSVIVDGFTRSATEIVSGAPVLAASTTDPDVLVLTATGIVGNSSYEPVLVCDTYSAPPDGVYEFRLLHNQISDIGFPFFMEKRTSFAFHPPAGFKGIRIYHAFGKTEVPYAPETPAIVADH